MTEREMRRLRRVDLLEMLVQLSKENQHLIQELEYVNQKLRNRTIAIETSGSMAEAALKLNGIFEAADAACKQYEENMAAMSRQQKELCKQMEMETAQKCAQMKQNAVACCAELEKKSAEKCARLEQITKFQCEQMLKRAREKAGFQ